ncbi:uncharacterized protein J7T55_015533 [Diaporthe amygdali]|uniref:uncharacterized protein n=1 Tax=Phomopsis amygdali TaxID=1214568 RepID=UPI0022FEC035|nr:uncharacterized protein J7T55_015533 [Diaporthe amygdali]KAJ0120798.1 uncharacterized protein J7T55_015533 [Diaporthe amygdali]
MQLRGLFHLLLLGAAAESALITPAGKLGKRDIEYNTTLYAYGADSTAIPIAYSLSDGLLYITESPDDSSANLTSVTWDVPFVSDENWVVNATFPNGTALGSLYIRPDQDNAVGVLPMTRASDVNGTVTGFARFAWQLVYNNNTLLESKFWAEPTDTDGIYALVWNSGGDAQDGSYDVVVEVIADS